MFDRLILTEDLVDCRGRLIGARGTVVSPETIAEAAARAPELPRLPLANTPLADDVEVPLSASVYRHLFDRERAREAVRSVLHSVSLPEPLLDELLELRRLESPIHAHAFATAAVAIRLLYCAVGCGRGVSDLAAAALLHDIGMRHMPARLFHESERLSPTDALRLAAHPLLGAYHLATVLGAHHAVKAAHVHHWRNGQGYPTLSTPPSRCTEVVSLASAFAALTQPRPFRAPYDARGASDVLVAEAAGGLADESSVRLLVHALRGGRGDAREIRFGRERGEQLATAARYAHVPPPARSYV